MHVSHLSLHDFRSYAAVEVALAPGATTFLGRNGEGKTNVVEAVDYIARLSSHRVASDTLLVRHGAERAVIRASVVRHDRESLLEVEINPGRSNRARINKSPLPRSREILGMARTVLFSPEDLGLVKGDPSERRRFLDELLVQRARRFAGVRSDYDRVLKQRNSLLKSAGGARRGTPHPSGSALSTLGVWDSHLARTGAELLAARLGLVEELRPLVGKAYENVARGATSSDAEIEYRPSFELPEGTARQSPDDEGHRIDRNDLAQAILAEVERRRSDELDRGVSLVGPHRDELTLRLGQSLAKGYASNGECWSFAVSLRLASYDLLRAGGDDPILILDDVFAELDTDRRERLAEMIGDAEQLLVTAAVPADVPVALRGVRMDVSKGAVTRAEA